MEKSLRSGALAAAGVVALFSGGVAHASPKVVGHPYSDATSTLGAAGNSAASPAGRAAAAAATAVVAKKSIEKSLLNQLATQGPRPAWVQCSDDLVAKVDSSIDCAAMTEQKRGYTVTVTGDDDGQISYRLEATA